MGDARVIRLTWEEWLAGRSAKRAALAAHGLSGECRRTSARPEARRQLQVLLKTPRDATPQAAAHETTATSAAR